MHGVGYAAALLLAVVFARAGSAKLRDRTGTAAAFISFGLPRAAATIVPLIELALAIALVLAPGWSAAVALALLAAFTVFLFRAVRSGSATPCNCFGSARASAVSATDLWRNGLLLLLAIGALPASGPTRPGVGALAAVLGAAAIGGAGLRRARGRAQRVAEGPPLGSTAAPIAGRSWDEPATLVAFFSPGCERCALERPRLDPSAHVVDLGADTRPIFDAYRVRATPYYVVVDADGLVRWRGAELRAAQRAR
jgi:hypothetical protein